VSGIVRDFPAMLLDIRARRLEVTERRFACREMQRHQPAGRIVDIHQQRAGRRTVLEPAVIAAIDLHQFVRQLFPLEANRPLCLAQLRACAWRERQSHAVHRNVFERR
jgi:hypothetical protein